MTTLPLTTAVSPSTTLPEVYEYGWRMVRRTTPLGEVIWERLPLTLADILHPQEGDFQVHSREHEQFCDYLADVLRARVIEDKTAVVLHDVRIAWDDPDIEPHGPDIAVIFNVQNQQNWSTFDTTTEGCKPSLIIEITSPKTREIDLSEKVNEYEEVGVPQYVIVDTYLRKGKQNRRLLNYRLIDGMYQMEASSGQRRVWLESVKLWLGFEEEDLVCYDEMERPLQNYEGVVKAWEQAEERAAVAEKRIRELEEKLQQLQKK